MMGLFQNLFAQSDLPKKNTSLGIDLIVGVISLSENISEESRLEIIFREQLDKSALRFRVGYTSYNPRYDDNSLFFDSTIYVSNTYMKDRQYSFAIGGQYQLVKSRSRFYGGIDLGFNYDKENLVVEECFIRNCDRLHFIPTKMASIELTPFVGWNFDLNPRFFLSIELGPYMQWSFGKRPFFTQQLEEKERDFSSFELNMARMLRDISINYRF